jgi:hypothetical protein
MLRLTRWLLRYVPGVSGKNILRGQRAEPIEHGRLRFAALVHADALPSDKNYDAASSRIHRMHCMRCRIVTTTLDICYRRQDNGRILFGRYPSPQPASERDHESALAVIARSDSSQ